MSSGPHSATCPFVSHLLYARLKYGIQRDAVDSKEKSCPLYLQSHRVLGYFTLYWHSHLCQPCSSGTILWKIFPRIPQIFQLQLITILLDYWYLYSKGNKMNPLPKQPLQMLFRMLLKARWKLFPVVSNMSMSTENRCYCNGLESVCTQISDDERLALSIERVSCWRMAECLTKISRDTAEKDSCPQIGERSLTYSPGL